MINGFDWFKLTYCELRQKLRQILRFVFRVIWFAAMAGVEPDFITHYHTLLNPLLAISMTYDNAMW